MDAKTLGDLYVGAQPGLPFVTDGISEHPLGVSGWMVQPQPGITLRQHFAGLAMQGILANRVYDPPRRDRLHGMALDAVAAADALLAELAKDAP